MQHLYSIPPEKIAVTALTNALDELEVSWVTDSITAANMRLALREGFGINGSAKFVPANDDGPALQVPVNIRLDHAQTYGRMNFVRDDEIRNPAPLPIKAHWLHALVIEELQPAIYSWSLDGAALPVGARLQLDTVEVPSQLDNMAQQIWIDYAIDHSCRDCIPGIIDKNMIGDVWPETITAVIRALTPLAETGASLLQVIRDHTSSDRTIENFRLARR